MVTSRPPHGYRLRRPCADDADAVTDLKRRVEIAYRGESPVTTNDVVEEWSLPRLRPEEDLWLVEAARGEVVGYAFVWPEDPPLMYVAEQTVHPAHRGHGLSALLLDLCEERAERAAQGTGHGRGVVLCVWTHESDASRSSLFEARGYRHVRTFLRLAADLADPPPPTWPAGIAVRGFRLRQDAAAVHAALDEAFRDHWRPEVLSLEEWRAYRLERPGLDLGLWWVAWDGEEVAGALEAAETPLGGYIEELAVRRPWRGRGLGRALLLQAFAELRRRGCTSVFLGVDSENPTGAVGLYGSVGMRAVGGANLVFEKELDRV